MFSRPFYVENPVPFFLGGLPEVMLLGRLPFPLNHKPV